VVVLLHGQPGSRSDWAGVINELSRTHRVLAPDRPGYGTNADSACGFDGNVYSLMARLDAVGIERAVFVGHSWGAGVALLAALRWPERTVSVVAVAPVVPGELGWSDRLLATPVLGLGAGALTLTAARAVGALPRLLSPLGFVEPRLARSIRRSCAGLQIRRATSMRVEARALVREFPALGTRLSEIRVPTTIVAGSKDRVVRRDALGALAKRLPDARLIVIGGGHLLPLEAPEALAVVIDAATRPSPVAA
jgi:pimeloyl-ACP methyl ester carboxylesterase